MSILFSINYRQTLKPPVTTTVNALEKLLNLSLLTLFFHKLSASDKIRCNHDCYRISEVSDNKKTCAEAFYLSFHKLSSYPKKLWNAMFIVLLKFSDNLIDLSTNLCVSLFINCQQAIKSPVTALVIVLQRFFINKKQKLFIESFFSINCQQAIKSAVTAAAVALQKFLSIKYKSWH